MTEAIPVADLAVPLSITTQDLVPARVVEVIRPITSEANVEAATQAAIDAVGQVVTASRQETIDTLRGGVASARDTLGKLDAVKANADDLAQHVGNTNNPHGTTADEVGAYSKAVSDQKVSDASTALVDGATSDVNTLKKLNAVLSARIAAVERNAFVDALILG